MKFIVKNNFAKLAALFLVVGLCGFYVLSIVTMQHDDPMGNDSLACGLTLDRAASAAAPMDNGCLDYHFGLLHNLSESLFSHGLGQLAALALLTLLAITTVSLFKILSLYVARRRLLWRRLQQQTKLAFFAQLGQWLALFAKRDPLLYTFAEA